MTRRPCSGTSPAVGLAVALAAGSLAQSRLYGISAFDALVLPGAIVTLAVVVLVASYVPARRASAVNPMEALRDE